MNTIVHTPTSKLEQSIDFYQRLRFQQIAHEKAHLFSDGQVLVEVNPDRYARAGLKLFRKSWQTEAGELKKLTQVITLRDGFLLSDPNGVRIYLVEGESLFRMALDRLGPSTLGKFAGLSLEVTDVQRTIAVWELAGFTHEQGAPEQGWVLLKNKDGIGISIMQSNSCPHLFFNPSLTYFNGKDNLSVIRNIREAGIAIIEEITYFNKEGIVDNIIIRDPGGFGFFIFSD